MTQWVRRAMPALWVLFLGVPALWVSAYLVEGVYGVPLRADSFRFERPWAGLLLLAVPVVWLSRVWLLKTAAPRLLVSRGRTLGQVRPGWRVWVKDLPLGLRVTALWLMGVALMGPQSVHARDRTEVDGIDIILVMDMSLSMQAADIRPNRFEATKVVVQDFVRRRPNDRIGAVVFGRDAFTLMPLTTDKEALQTVIAELQLELIEGRGTAIGNAIGTGLNRLRPSRAKSKVIILLTDGDSNAGNVSPEQAAELAATMEVKIFTVLMGVSDDAPVAQSVDLTRRTIFGMQNLPVNPELLQRIAARTGGAHYNAADRGALERSFHNILDQLERSEIEDLGQVYGELYPAFVWPGLLLLLLEAVFGALVLRRWP